MTSMSTARPLRWVGAGDAVMREILRVPLLRECSRCFARSGAERRDRKREVEGEDEDEGDRQSDAGEPCQAEGHHDVRPDVEDPEAGKEVQLPVVSRRREEP